MIEIDCETIIALSRLYIIFLKFLISLLVNSAMSWFKDIIKQRLTDQTSIRFEAQLVLNVKIIRLGNINARFLVCD